MKPVNVSFFVTYILNGNWPLHLFFVNAHILRALNRRTWRYLLIRECTTRLAVFSRKTRCETWNLFKHVEVTIVCLHYSCISSYFDGETLKQISELIFFDSPSGRKVDIQSDRKKENND